MTIEPDLTEAMEVWRKAVIAYGGLSMEGETEILAARVIATALEARDAEIARLKQVLKTQAAAVRTLHHHEASEINVLRSKQTEAHRAVVTLDSEREANAILTEELAERDAAIVEAVRRGDEWGRVYDGSIPDSSGQLPRIRGAAPNLVVAFLEGNQVLQHPRHRGEGRGVCPQTCTT